MVKIGIDIMGGDYAPTEVIKGAQEFLKDNSNVHLFLIGRENEINSELQKNSLPKDSFTVINASQVIEMHEHPTKALKEKTDSSIAVGFGLLAAGKTDAFISAGNTGAMMVGSLFSIKTIEGVMRPTIGAYLPRENGSLGLLLDVGLNADCKADNLNQFAILGSLYAEHILKVPNPKVGLINIGEEEGKGNLLYQGAFPLLKNNPYLNFIGNIEGRDILLDKADVCICDGFTGNVILKLAESVFDIVQRRKIKDEHFDRFNFEEYGGVPVLGVAKPVIVGHGISHFLAFKNMLNIARKMIETDFTGKMHQAFSHIKS